MTTATKSKRAQSEESWLRDYVERYSRLLAQPEAIRQLQTLKAWMLDTHRAGRKVIFAGNGGSAAMASHCAVDFTKNAGIRCINFNEADLITCFANDYGYEQWVARALEFYADPGDLVILISSSGKSPNMVHAARYAREGGLKLVTLTGLSSDNPLRALGDLNFWVDSRAYNMVEMTHHIWLLAVCDLLIGKAEYPASPRASHAG